MWREVRIKRGRFRVKTAEERKLFGWFASRLGEGKNQGLRTILLTGYHPYEYGDPELNKLADDLRPFLRDGLIDLWRFSRRGDG